MHYTILDYQQFLAIIFLGKSGKSEVEAKVRGGIKQSFSI